MAFEQIEHLVVNRLDFQDDGKVGTSFPIDGSITSVDSVVFDTSAINERATGKVWWDEVHKTLAVGIGDAVSLQIGQEFVMEIQNQTGETINEGVLLMGETDNNGRLKTVGDGIIRAVKAIANGTLPSKLALGITTETIATGDRGMVTVNGYIQNVDTSAYDNGDILWANPAVAGGLTVTPPTAPNWKLPIAVVTKKSTQGSIYVRMTQGSELGGTDSNVQITNPQDGQVLKYQASTGLWINSF